MNSQIEMILRLLLATFLGAGIGYQGERATPSRPGYALTRLVVPGAALFTVASIFSLGNGVDSSRVAGGAVVGIGHLGAGVIFRTSGDWVAGVVAAASIWVAAPVGLAAGAGM